MSNRSGSRSSTQSHEDEIKQKLRTDLAHKESDLAYFQARLEIIGEPGTTNEHAQHKLFQMLCRTVGTSIVHTKKEIADLKKKSKKEK